MPAPAIRVEALGKRYRLHHQLSRESVALRDVIADKAREIGRRLAGRSAASASGSEEEFWALRDVSFEVKQGEVVGIIGRNGAGKSTLLKILSRVTDPSEGRVRIRGRVASLLEVGTGFHPELTGRENIFLNGAILGMSRREVRRKFDEIVSFAGVERFIDTPVKHYSSGMYVRLAFGVGAHLDPEILVVDEVLAVGDAEFQKRCLGKMRAVSAEKGRTVLFVSHNLAAIHSLCSKVAYLSSGKLIGFGDTSSQVSRYTRDLMVEQERGSGTARKIANELYVNRLSIAPNPASSGEAVEFLLEMTSSRDEILSDLSILIYSTSGLRVAILDLRKSTGGYRIGRENSLKLSGKIQRLNLVEGDYLAGLYVRTGDYQGDQYDLCSISIMKSGRPAQVAPYPPHDRGLVELEYEFDRVQPSAADGSSEIA